LEYLWVNKLFRKLVGPDADGDPRAQSIWAKVPKISCEHGKKGPMRFWPFVGFIMFYSISKLSLSTHFHSFSRQGFHKLESKTKIHVVRTHSWSLPFQNFLRQIPGFYSGPEALSRGDRLFELMLAPTTAELMEEVGLHCWPFSYDDPGKFRLPLRD